MKNFSTNILFCAAYTCCFLSHPVFAQVSVTNGDFELPGTNVFSTFAQGITAWGESNVGHNSFADFLIAGDMNQQGAFQDGQTAGISNHVVGNGHLYQEIGTPGGLPVLRIQGLNFWRNDNSNQHGELLVQVYWLPASDGFTFQEFGNDIATVGNLIASEFIADPGAQNQTVPFTIDVDVSELDADSRLFLRFDAGTPGQFAYVDDVSATMIEPVSVANGDFELPGENFFSTFAQGIPLWGEDNVFGNNFADFLIIGDGNQQGAFMDGQTAGISNHVVGNGFLYQEIGTPGFLPFLQISGLNFWRNDMSNQHGQLLVEVYSLPANDGFVFQEFGNDVALSGSFIDSFLVDDPSAQNEFVPFVFTVDVSALASDSRLFVRFDAGTPGQFAYIDNVAAMMKSKAVLGDVNRDGVINLLDVEPFITQLSGGLFQLEADINEDGIVNLLDVEPFITVLSGG